MRTIDGVTFIEGQAPTGDVARRRHVGDDVYDVETRSGRLFRWGPSSLLASLASTSWTLVAMPADQADVGTWEQP